MTLRVTDDGIGVPSDGRRGGLTNLADRAAKFGGSFTVLAKGDPSGTDLTWSVPLNSPPAEG